MTAADERPDGRRGNRRIHVASGDPTRDGAVAIIPPLGRALPGEAEPLKPRRGRNAPVTEAEALGVMRRKRRAEVAKQHYGAQLPPDVVEGGLPEELEAEVPGELPGWTTKKVPVTFRLPPRLRAYIDALSELEGANFAAELELALWQAVQQPPRSRQQMRQLLIDYTAQTVAQERLEIRFGKA